MHSAPALLQGAAAFAPWWQCVVGPVLPYAQRCAWVYCCRHRSTKFTRAGCVWLQEEMDKLRSSLGNAILEERPNVKVRALHAVAGALAGAPALPSAPCSCVNSGCWHCAYVATQASSNLPDT